jgi:hypothetical protein
MKKIDKIMELLHGAPTLWDVYGYQKPWTTEELNTMSVNEAILKIHELALQFARSEMALVQKYFEIRSELDSQILLDVMIKSPDEIPWETFRSMEYTLDDLIKNVTIIPAKVGDMVKVNVRTITPFSPDVPVALFFNTSGAIQGMHAGSNKVNPDMWAYANAQVIAPGTFNLGTMITGIKRSVMFIVED